MYEEEDIFEEELDIEAEDDFSDFEDEGEKYGAAFADLERTNKNPINVSDVLLIKKDGKLKYNKTLSASDKFKLGLIKFLAEFNDDYLKLTKTELSNLDAKADYLPLNKLPYLNAAAIILAFYVDKKGKIDRDKLEKVQSLTEDVSVEDIIRYHRFLAKLKMLPL
jgi:hypothetical protein